jgi:hypothetical protein
MHMPQDHVLVDENRGGMMPIVIVSMMAYAIFCLINELAKLTSYTWS